MKLRYWTNYSKRKNSTLQANLLTGTEIDINLLDASSIINPIFQTKTVPDNANYFYIADFGRYYFVDVVTKISKDITEFKLEVDVLASFKSSIGAANAMIMRSSTGYNVWIPDDEVYVSTQKTLVRTVDTVNVGFAKSPGCFLLSVINEDGCATGFACQYFTDAAGLSNLANQLMNSSFVQDVMKYSSDVSAGIVSLKWMPFDLPTKGFVTLSNYKVSNLELNSAGYKITGNAYFLDGATSITIPWRTDKDYREASPYTAAKLLIPMYGLVELNTSDLVGATSLYIQYRVDRSTGDVIVIINKDSAGEVLQTIQFNVAVEVPIATMTRDIGGAVSSISGGVNSAIGIAAGNYIGGTAGLISAAAGFALSANGRSVSLKGSLHGKAALAYGDQFQLLLYVPHTLDPTNANFIATKGRPCQYVDTISNHSGFIRCASASVDMAGSALEKDRVNEYLNAGFYYE